MLAANIAAISTQAYNMSTVNMSIQMDPIPLQEHSPNNPLVAIGSHQAGVDDPGDES